MRRKPPIGISDFCKLREKNYYYVDKTLLIRDVLEAPAEILLLPRPRRFGKTLNLSLLRYFFENSPENDALFEDLAISQVPEALAHRGKYPVVFLTFKDIKKLRFEDCFQNFQSILAGEYRRHQPILKSTLDEGEAKDTQKILMKTGEPALLEESLRKLTELLHRATGRKVILLIDEYDTPIHAAHASGYYTEAVSLIRNLLGSTLKDNPHIEKAVLTGILRVARESMFSGLNNLAVHTILQKPFSRRFV